MALPSLAPQALLPHQYSDRARALTLLRRIDYVEIRETVKRGSARHYAVDIHYKLTPSGIPTSQLKRRPTVPSPRDRCHRPAPAVRVLRRFSEFSNLCIEMFFHVRSGHETSTPCAFCCAYTTYTNVSATQPRLAMKLLHSDDSVRSLLERLLNDVLGLVMRGVKAFGGRDCIGQEHVPPLLLEFLLPHEASLLGATAMEMSVQALRVATTEALERAAAEAL